MRQLFLGLASLPFIASVAMAGQQVALSDTQMDKVTAGDFTFSTLLIPADSILKAPVPITLGSFSATYNLSYPNNPEHVIAKGF
jgi:hypothetical protein